MWRQNSNLTRINAYTAILKAIGHYYSASSISIETLNDAIEIQEEWLQDDNEDDELAFDDLEPDGVYLDFFAVGFCSRSF